MAGNPWDNDPIVGTAGIGRPVIRKGPEPVKPDLPQGYGMTGDTATPVKGLPPAFTTPETYRPMSRDEKVGAGLNPDKPFQVSSKGQITTIGSEDKADAAAATDPDRAFQADTVLKSIANIRDLATKNFSLGAGSDYLRLIPIIGQNAANMHDSLDQVKGDILRNVLAQSKQASPNGASGFGNLSNVEGEALKASIAHMQQSQDADEFTKGLDQAEQYYRRSLARAQGLDPADPATATRLKITLPEGSHDNGITGSNPLPVVNVGPQIGVSGTEKALINPLVAAIAPQVAAYLNAPKTKVSDAMILGFIQKNGIKPSDWPQLTDALKNRGKVQFQVDPHYNKPLSDAGVIPGTSFLSERDRAQAAASPTGAFLSGATDTGTFGASPDLAGAVSAASGGSFGQGRREFQDKQELQAYEQPGPTFAGNAAGGLSTMLAAAPENFFQLLTQTGKQGGLYGFLSSPDASLGGRTKNAILSGTANTVAAATLDPALRGVAMGGRKAANGVRRLAGTPAEDIADSNALNAFASHAPNQSVSDMRARFDEQTGLGADPTGLATADRAGQDYLGRQVARSPGARQAADKAVETAQAKLPAQLENDFHSAIDDAAGGQTHVATFLKRPAREITKDVQDMAGREFEHGIAPIRKEPVTVNDEILSVLTDDQAGSAIRDAMRQGNVDQETVNGLRGLPRLLNQVAGMDPKLRDKVLKSGGVELTVDMAHRIARGFNRMADKLDDTSDLKVRLRELSRTLRDNISADYPEFGEANARYASRQRAIEALDTTRQTFLGDSTGKKTDILAKAMARMSDKPGEPELSASVPTDPTKFNITRQDQSMPSEKQMAMAGAKEATVAKAANGDSAGTAEKLSRPGQQERNRMILADRASKLEARASAKAGNVRTLERLQSGGTADDAGGKVAAGMKAVGNLGFHRAGAAIASALSGIRGLGPDDAARVVKLYTDPNKTEQVIDALEKAYGRRKARFIIARVGAFATTAIKTKPLPAEATARRQ